MKIRNRKVPGYLLYLLFLAVAALLYFNLAYPKLAAQNAQLQQTHDHNTQQIAYFRQMLTQETAMQKDIAALRKKLETSKKADSISPEGAADDLHTACRYAGITPSRIELQSPAAVAGKTTADHKQLYGMPISLGFTCSSTQLQKLLHYFETVSPGAYYIQQTQYTPKGSGSATLSTTLSLSLYYLAAPPRSAVSSAVAAS